MEYQNKRGGRVKLHSIMVRFREGVAFHRMFTTQVKLEAIRFLFSNYNSESLSNEYKCSEESEFNAGNV